MAAALADRRPGDNCEMSVEWFGQAKGDPAVVVDPDAAWPQQAAAWIARLSARLEALPVHVEHVGSTAIAGLPAKPVLDLQVAVPDIDDEQAYRPALEALGLILRARESDHRFFRPPADQPRTVHVHVCQRDSTWERDHLLFRDYLRAHPDKAHDYAALKRQLAETVGDDRNAYTAGKTAFIERTLRDADAWARHTTYAADATHPPTNHDDMSPTTSRPLQPDNGADDPR
jgi:GrpB-like predicted nucleotidyltransferase (UPF0157 family)